MNNTISVIIPTYNSAPYIKEAVDSCLNQTYRPIEVIVVDDGSTDNTQEILSSYIESGRINYLSKENGGPASARNKGVRMARGEIVAFLDADDIWKNDKLDRQVTLFSNQAVGFVYSDMQFFGTQVEHILHSQTTSGYFRGAVINHLIFNNFVPTSSVLVRKKIFDEVGIFDEDKKLVAVEDYDLWLRVADICKIDFVDMPLVQYRVHSAQISKDPASSYRKLFYLYRKHIHIEKHFSHKILFAIRYFLDLIRCALIRFL